MKTLKQFFEILRPHWFGKGAAKLWALLLLALGFSLAIIKISVLMNAWDKRFYDALSELKGELIPALVGEFFALHGAHRAFYRLRQLASQTARNCLARAAKRDDGAQMAT